MISILKQVINTKNAWGLKPLIIGAVYELIFLIKHIRFKYLFVIEPENMDISNEESKVSEPYVPSPYYILTISLKQIKKFITNIQNSIFFDIGCGPGRALYCSSTIGFNRLIGIEQSKKLTDICNQNLIKYASPRANVKIINQNVKNINFTDLITDISQEQKTDALVFFLYTPFKDEMLQVLLDKFDELNTYDCFIIFFGPQKESMMIQKNFSVVYKHFENQDCPVKIYSRKKSPDSSFPKK